MPRIARVSPSPCETRVRARTLELSWWWRRWWWCCRGSHTVGMGWVRNSGGTFSNKCVINYHWYVCVYLGVCVCVCQDLFWIFQCVPYRTRISLRLVITFSAPSHQLYSVSWRHSQFAAIEFNERTDLFHNNHTMGLNYQSLGTTCVFVVSIGTVSRPQDQEHTENTRANSPTHAPQSNRFPTVDRGWVYAAACSVVDRPTCANGLSAFLSRFPLWMGLHEKPIELVIAQLFRVRTIDHCERFWSSNAVELIIYIHRDR